MKGVSLEKAVNSNFRSSLKAFVVIKADLFSIGMNGGARVVPQAHEG
jgi:hypothetical protein